MEQGNCLHYLHVAHAAGPAADTDSPAATLACQSLLRLFHERLKAFTGAITPATTAQIVPQRQAAAGRIQTWEQQLLEQVSKTWQLID